MELSSHNPGRRKYVSAQLDKIARRLSRLRASPDKRAKNLRPEDEAMLFAVGQIRRQVENLSEQIKRIQ